MREVKVHMKSMRTTYYAEPKQNGRPKDQARKTVYVVSG